MDYSRAIQNDNSQGGSEVLYIFPFVEYSSSQITVINNFLTVFPYNIIYHLEAFKINFDEELYKKTYLDEMINYNAKIIEQEFINIISKKYTIINNE